jgi:nicotinamidase/pyrazinamidase
MKALIIVDIQNDFIPGGALPVPDGDAIIPIVNSIQTKFDLVVATQDWHPGDHKSFASMHPGKKPFDVIDLEGLTQTLWPAHCVQGSRGAEFHQSLDMQRVEAIFRKGMDSTIDSYSGFADNGHRKTTGLSGYLKDRNITEVYICGLAGDYCVYFTAKDAIAHGFRTVLIEDATRAIQEVGFNAAKKDLLKSGGHIVISRGI